MMFIGKLYNLFNVKLFSKKRFFMSIKVKLSILKILLKNNILKSNNKKNRDIVVINNREKLIIFLLI